MISSWVGKLAAPRPPAWAAGERPRGRGRRERGRPRRRTGRRPGEGLWLDRRGGPLHRGLRFGRDGRRLDRRAEPRVGLRGREMMRHMRLGVRRMGPRLLGRGDPGRGLRETGEELVGHALGDAVDQARAELGDLAPDMGLDGVAEQGSALHIGERNLGAALGEAGDPAFTLAGDGVAHVGNDVGKLDLASEGGRNRADLDLGDRRVAVADPLERLAAGDAGLQHVRVVEQRPDLWARGRESRLPGHRHRHEPSPPAADGADAPPRVPQGAFSSKLLIAPSRRTAWSECIGSISYSVAGAKVHIHRMGRIVFLEYIGNSVG